MEGRVEPDFSGARGEDAARSPLRIVHMDAIVICERPKLGPHFPAMRAALAKALGLTTDESI